RALVTHRVESLLEGVRIDALLGDAGRFLGRRPVPDDALRHVPTILDNRSGITTVRNIGRRCAPGSFGEGVGPTTGRATTGNCRWMVRPPPEPRRAARVARESTRKSSFSGGRGSKLWGAPTSRGKSGAAKVPRPFRVQSPRPRHPPGGVRTSDAHHRRDAPLRHPPASFVPGPGYRLHRF